MNIESLCLYFVLGIIFGYLFYRINTLKTQVEDNQAFLHRLDTNVDHLSKFAKDLSVDMVERDKGTTNRLYKIAIICYHLQKDRALYKKYTKPKKHKK